MTVSVDVMTIIRWTIIFLLIGLYFGIKYTQTILAENNKAFTNRKLIISEICLMSGWILMVLWHVIETLFRVF